MIDNAEKELRKQLKLPISKQLRYMRQRNGSFEAFNVDGFEVVESFPSGWHLLDVALEGGEHVKIHSMYFSEMQKASFEKDMAKIGD